eukprot:gene10289-11190_t
MGGAPSTAEPAASKAKLHRNEKEIVKLMMPVYYTVQEVSIEERKLASNSWDLILNEKSPEFLSKKGDPDFPYQSYGIVGEVLFWCLKRCVGAAVYTQSVHNAWVKVYCRMLRTIVPIAVALELRGQSQSQVTRITMRDSFVFSSSNPMESLAELSADDLMEEGNLESEKIRRAETTTDKIK